METNKLGITTTLAEIKEFIKQGKSFEFAATTKQVNLDNVDIQAYISKMGHVEIPPLLNKFEILNALSLIKTDNDSLKWDYITLLTYLNNGEITYHKIDDNNFLVTIKF
jgi:hypothetical protein